MVLRMDTKRTIGIRMHAYLVVGEAIGLENALQKGGVPRVTGTETEVVMAAMNGPEPKLRNVLEKMIDKGEPEVQNMYEEVEGWRGVVWKCPGCGEAGQRINKVFATCSGRGCLGVAAEGTYREMDNRRVAQIEISLRNFGTSALNFGPNFGIENYPVKTKFRFDQ